MRPSDDKTITMDEARELVADAALWPRVRDFLWDFAPSIHPTWLDGLTVGQFAGSDLTNLLETVKPSNCQPVKQFILDSLGVEPCFHTFPKDDGSRLLLLDGAMLESLVKWLGALACADALRKVTDGATVRALKAALPGVYPEVFGFAAYFKSKVESLKVDSLNPELVISAGWKILSSSLSQLPECLLRRLVLKLPKGFGQPDPRLSTFDFRLSTANLQLLLKLRFPEAYALCC